MPLSRPAVVPVLLLLLLLTALCPAFLAAEELSVEVATRAGMLYGLARELVYSGSFAVSELNWRFQPVAYAGTALSLKTPLGLAATVEVRSAFPGKSGTIDDLDYLNYKPSGGVDERLTHYSAHDCYTERAVLLDARLGWVFRLGPIFSLEPFGAFGLMQLKWTARDGYLQYEDDPQSLPPYEPWSPTTLKLPVSGTGIIYQQTYLIPALGVRLAADFAERFDASVRLIFAPYVFANNLDNHAHGQAPDVDYYDYLRGGILVEPTVSLGFRPAPRARLSLDVSYRGIFGLVGDTEKVYSNPGLEPGLVVATYPNGAGASYSALDASLALTLSL
jgi:outer membrane protease